MAQSTYLVDRDNLTVGLLDTLLTLDKVPKSRFGYNVIGSEQTHAIKFRSRVLFRWHSSANDLVFLELF
jgi:hypothetical protein